ncbi:hypothetical protein TSTA_039730 [Talaromyces stipitatus ATCC 10500]|uniref:Ankyrin repeat-containing protein n=1 Tax=Talaromyces stipitatus (strain ATCC 10500 / CBS 375.48 / QM 6759 / NRRL 1006) TaxID=441959 RepID=B8M435_TALSN|nr:uncharacterized protein TSTA_039730 [Talaromyces stipitatus ATCC 10500]EED20778.1 hypothetical protein TSTA_039730 [Talaromyces stipitatus ATCC 10500]
MSYHHFRTNRSDVAPPRDIPVCLHDQDGTMLYEDDFAGLRNRIIMLNDAATLEKYIVKDPIGALAPTDLFYHDPFFIAAKYGSTDALHLLLELYNNIACQHAQIETACFLLDSQPPLGNVHTRSKCGDTTLLRVASSLEIFEFEDFKDNNYSLEWIRERFARSEDLMQLLLDRGASARDSNTVGTFREHYDKGKSQPRDIVLGLAVTHASYGLVKRLIGKGADILRRDWYQRKPTISFGGDCVIDAQNVTAVHISSLYWNYWAPTLHWAAAGPTFRNELTIPESEVGMRIIDTSKLLLDAIPNIINLQDKEGATALHYTVSSHAECGAGHCGDAIRFLCDIGIKCRGQKQ